MSQNWTWRGFPDAVCAVFRSQPLRRQAQVPQSPPRVLVGRKTPYFLVSLVHNFTIKSGTYLWEVLEEPCPFAFPLFGLASCSLAREASPTVVPLDAEPASRELRSSSYCNPLESSRRSYWPSLTKRSNLPFSARLGRWGDLLRFRGRLLEYQSRSLSRWPSLSRLLSRLRLSWDAGRSRSS